MIRIPSMAAVRSLGYVYKKQSRYVAIWPEQAPLCEPKEDSPK